VPGCTPGSRGRSPRTVDRSGRLLLLSHSPIHDAQRHLTRMVRDVWHCEAARPPVGNRQRASALGRIYSAALSSARGLPVIREVDTPHVRFVRCNDALPAHAGATPPATRRAARFCHEGTGASQRQNRRRAPQGYSRVGWRARVRRSLHRKAQWEALKDGDKRDKRQQTTGELCVMWAYYQMSQICILY